MITPSEFLAEAELEAVTTRKMLAQIPNDKFGWKPHPKSMDIKTLANHLVDIAYWPAMMIETTELDFQNMGGYEYPNEDTTEGLLAFFDKNIEKTRKALKAGEPEDLEPTWTMRSGKDIYIQEPRRSVIRTALSQTTHHRAQLGVYLRLLDIPIPGSYGPSADEMMDAI